MLVVVFYAQKTDNRGFLRREAFAIGGSIYFRIRDLMDWRNYLVRRIKLFTRYANARENLRYAD